MTAATSSRVPDPAAGPPAVPLRDERRDASAMTSPSSISTDDRRIQSAIIAEFERTAAFRFGEVGVGVMNGVVTLSGVLDTIAQLRSAVYGARRTHGVVAVSNDLLIHLSSFGAEHDRGVTAVIAHALRAADDVSAAAICVRARDGVAVLSGTVASAAERATAVAVVERLRDVRSIENEIKVGRRSAEAVGRR
jgi:osmotically-inducible protein OsmY